MKKFLLGAALGNIVGLLTLDSEMNIFKYFFLLTILALAGGIILVGILNKLSNGQFRKIKGNTY